MNKLEQAARQALGALEEYRDTQMIQAPRKAITTLREALDHFADAGNKVSDHIAASGKVILTEEQAQQIEEALDELRYANNTDIAKTKYYKALSTIRAARAQEQAEHEPMKECRHCGFLCKPNPNESGKWHPLEQAEQEPVMDYERLNALREGEQNGAEDAYFFVRPENDTPTLRKMFCQGFERGFHKGIKYAAPVVPVRQEPVAWGDDKFAPHERPVKQEPVCECQRKTDAIISVEKEL